MSATRFLASYATLLLSASTAIAGVNGPIRSVTLSSGGLAEIVRSATIDDSAGLDIDVPIDQVDDILKSLVIRDDKGRVKSMSLTGPKPVDETFKTSPFKPSDLASLPSLLNSIKGSRIRVGDGQEGMVLGVTDIPGNAQSSLSWQLSLLRDDGTMSMVAIPGTAISIVDPTLKTKLKRAMQIIGKANLDVARNIHIELDRQDSRNVDVSYVVPAPIWKTSYRLVTGVDGSVRLQAWAVFENASGEDWSDVGITLSSGQPVTLRQRLYDHFWRQRLEVPMDTSELGVNQPPPGALLAKRSMPPLAIAPPPPAPIAATSRSNDGSMAHAADPGLTVEGNVTSTFVLSGRYNIKNGDTIAVPILDHDAKAEMVSLFRPESGSEHPTAASLVDNDSGVSLPPGIITVYDGKQGFVGDAQIPALPNGQKQAVSFALDQKVSITTEPKSKTTITRIRVVNGLIYTSSVTSQEIIYKIRGASDAPRTILIEQDKQPGWSFKADGMIEGTVTKDRMKIELRTGEVKAAKASLSIVNEESTALADAEPDALMQWQDAAADPAMRAKLAELSTAKAEQDGANRKLSALDEEFARVEADQQRARSNLQSVGSGDTKSRFEKLLNSTENKLENIEKLRGEQREIISVASEKVSAAIRSF
ncbi:MULTISPECIES: DUF4139 domain-containing protein [Rhizobium]|uniref:DUF4139 domain-containing protein n=1 Tax=Rhizobium rhododendri TaxID=2506430 RepID=A0ABY8IQG4_9HYPH|nr:MULTISPECIES: DUF4139 domain-containing protein [Rhizobium]WFS25966.1 DUF4139 domain-containing protein [Rhizobium rhododendri]